MSFITRTIVAAALAAGLSAPALAADIELRFYYPVAVGGPITKLIDEYAAAFERENPGIKVKPIYSGDYVQTIAKALTAIKGGDSPELAILLAADIMTLIDEDAVIPIQDLAKTEADKAWLEGFFPGFLENARAKGKIYAVPFQRSTPVMFYNRDMFKEAGLDPNVPPKTWEEMVAFAKKLTKRDASGNVTQWGLEIPSNGNTSWLYTGLATGNDVRLVNAAGDETHFDDARAIEAAQFYLDLSKVHGVQPPGITDWGTAPRDFLERKIAMVWTTTGNLTNIRTNAKFPFGVAMLPYKVHPGAPTGGGNFYVFKNISPEKQEAALKFIRWMTTPERAAQWSIATGYVATSPAAWATPAMRAYAEEVPQAAVARDQLQYAVSEITVHDGQRVMKIINDALQAVLTGAKTAQVALGEAQRDADKVLKSYR